MSPQHAYHTIYQQGKFAGISNRLPHHPLTRRGKRPSSIAVCGGAFGDEGKGRVTDELTARFLQRHSQVIHYRDNGGSNAGHTVQVGATRLALHQLSSGVMLQGCTVVSGKGMVIHPEDFVAEISAVKKDGAGKLPSTLILDEQAALCLDTHRAFESALKQTISGGEASTGRGISPAYADIIYRHPLKLRDLARPDWRKAFQNHYQLYRKLIKGLGFSLADIEVSRLTGPNVPVGSETAFLTDLAHSRTALVPFIQSCYQLIEDHWQGDTPFVFEKAQALGLDARWGVYPDVTASDCSFEGIRASTEGIVDSHQISAKVAVIKATYTSSVGKRIMPSAMSGALVDRIREDAHEYGATTGRPRDIHHLDIPLIHYLLRVGQVDYLVPTHLDIVYPNTPIKICIAYEKDGRQVPYRPDQEYLLGVKPKFIDLPTWDQKAVRKAKSPTDLPKTCLQFLAFLEHTLGVNILMATTGPKRHQTITWFD